MIKAETIENFNSQIKNIEKKMTNNNSPVNTRLELEVSRVELEYQNNEHDYNYAKLNYDEFAHRKHEMGRIYF